MSESQVPPELREQAERASQLEAEAAQREEHSQLQALEIAGLRSGVDLTSRQGKAWAAVYDGDWNDGDAMKSDFDTMFPNAEPLQVDPPTNEDPRQGETFDTGMSKERQQINSVPNSAVVPVQEGDPYSEGFEAMDRARKEGRPEQNARAEVLNRVIDAAGENDPRVLWTNSHREAWIEETGAREHR